MKRLVKSQSAVYSLSDNTIFLLTSLAKGGTNEEIQQLNLAIKELPGKEITLDLSGIRLMDPLGIARIVGLKEYAESINKSLIIKSASPQIAKMMDFYQTIRSEESLVLSRPILLRIGEWGIVLGETIKELLFHFSESAYWTVASLFLKRGHRKGAILSQALVIGADAVPIVSLILFLIGIVLVLLSAQQLKQFGANIYVADLLVIAMIMEMGPLITAIILAGRSGAAIAAEIGTMAVSEELDALETMALNPIRFVVVPKVWGIVITMPLLTILGTVVGIAGGMLIAMVSLDITPAAFYAEAKTVVAWDDIRTSLIKSYVFAFLIVSLSSFFGMRTRGGPEGVGRSTTSSVVATIFAVIIADAGLDLIFYL